MKEDFLHYVWKYQKFRTQNLVSTIGDSISIIRVGQHNFNSGPDFFNAQLFIGDQLWVGNVEIHKKSNDWYLHQHEKDINYDNVILHVVWEYDTEIFRKDNSVIPTLELKSILDDNVLKNYLRLFSKKKQWINCENDIFKIDFFIINNWLETLYIERLQAKALIFEEELKKSNNHWEELLFKLLCKNFGLKVNGDSFFSIAQSIDLTIIKKCNYDSVAIESLLFGQAGFFETKQDDSYFKELKEKYQFLKIKFGLDNNSVIFPKYFRLRPTNFPTIRLSQLAVLYSEKQSLFSRIIEAKSLKDYYKIFSISANEYWNIHYNFAVKSVHKEKKMTQKFIDLLLINTIIPLKFCYKSYLGQDVSEEIINFAFEIPSEENTIIKKFQQLGFTSNNSLQSQGILQLKNEYCIKNQCLKCAIGNSILKKF